MKPAKAFPSIEFIKSILDYNPITGKFRWVKTNKIAGWIEKQPLGQNLFYRRIQHKNYKWLAHRLAYYIMTGLQPEQVDHANGNGLDNRFENLRDGSINPLNKPQYVNNTSGVTGVYYRKESGRWKALYPPQRLSKTFATYQEAVAQRKEWEDIFGMTTLKSKRTST